jgi:HEPN domain-containing protein
VSEEKHNFEATRWVDQAAEDLDAARVLRDAEKYAQACFYSQQAAEKALKGIGWRCGFDLWGHSVLELRDDLKEAGAAVGALEDEDLVLLDRFYIPTRYPNGLPHIIPQRGFCRADADAGIAAAEKVLKCARSG